MTSNDSYSRPIPLLAIVLVALAIHGPLLLMQLPSGSFDANFHIFLASHYAHHWFNPWNEKWFAGFSQTTYPPLTHQLIALVSTVTGLKMGYMLVQLAAVLLLPVGVFRFARIWVEDAIGRLRRIRQHFPGSALLPCLPGRTTGDDQFGCPLFECIALLLRVVYGAFRARDAEGYRGKFGGGRSSPRHTDLWHGSVRRTCAVGCMP